MRLVLSSRHVRNTIFTHESGQVLYKTTHPVTKSIGMKVGTTTVYKVKPNEDPMDMRNQFDVIGEIEWHEVETSTLRLNDQDMPSNKFIPAHRRSRRKRTFTGPDGRCYRWDMTLGGTVVLSRDDELRTEVARFDKGSYGIIGRKRQPNLKVEPEMEYMLDLIVLTFVYVEKLRVDMDGETTLTS